jgi:hypothetical protein
MSEILEVKKKGSSVAIPALSENLIDVGDSIRMKIVNSPGQSFVSDDFYLVKESL